MDAFKEHSNVFLCYAIFVSATFIGQIMFLNMLIAIMSESYDLFREQRPKVVLKNMMKIMGEMAA